MVMLPSPTSSSSHAPLLFFFLFFFLFSKPSLLSLGFYFGVFGKMERKNKGNGLYNLLASKFYVWFWYYGWKENEEKWFIKCSLLSTRVKTQFSSINPHTPIYSHKSTH